MAEGLSVKPVRAITWTEVGGREAALIQRCAARDEEACAELVNEHQRMVYQLALNLLGEHNEALDLSQEVFLRVFRTIHTFRGQSSVAEPAGGTNGTLCPVVGSKQSRSCPIPRQRELVENTRRPIVELHVRLIVLRCGHVAVTGGVDVSQ